jgi:hypothetical protein
MIKDYKFKVITPPDKRKEFVYKLLINYKRNMHTYLGIDDILYINDV